MTYSVLLVCSCAVWTILVHRWYRESIAEVACANGVVVSAYIDGWLDGGVIKVDVRKEGKKLVKTQAVESTYKSRLDGAFVTYRSDGDEVIGIAERESSNRLIFLLAPETLDHWPSNSARGKALLERLRSGCHNPLKDSFVLK